MSTFSTSKMISRCIVKKSMLEQIENYILQMAADIEGEHYKSDNYEVVITDSSGEESLHRICEYRHPTFPADTESISLSYRHSFDSHTELKLSVKFGVSHPSAHTNHINVTLTADDSRARVAGITDEMSRIIRCSEYHHFLCRRTIETQLTIGAYGYSLGTAGMIASVLFIFVSFQLAIHVGAVLIGLMVLTTLYLKITDRLPYCYFDSPATDRRIEQLRYYTRALIIIPLAQALIQLVTILVVNLPSLLNRN